MQTLCLCSTIGLIRHTPVCLRLISNCRPIPELEAEESNEHEDETTPGKRKVGKVANNDQQRKKKKRKKMVGIRECE